MPSDIPELRAGEGAALQSWVAFLDSYPEPDLPCGRCGDRGWNVVRDEAGFYSARDLHDTFSPVSLEKHFAPYLEKGLLRARLVDTQDKARFYWVLVTELGRAAVSLWHVQNEALVYGP